MRLIDADAVCELFEPFADAFTDVEVTSAYVQTLTLLANEPSIDAVSVVRCKNCKKSHIDGKTTHYLWCTEWGRSTDVFGYCERGEREGE